MLPSSLKWKSSQFDLCQFNVTVWVIFPPSWTEQVMGPGQGTGDFFSMEMSENIKNWEIKFLGYMQLQKLKDTITAAEDTEIDAAKNEEVFTELIQFLDDKSLALKMRDAQDDGSKALKILKSPLRWYRQAKSDFIVHRTDSASEVGTQDGDWLCHTS